MKVTLYTQKQGKHARDQKETTVLKVKCLRDYIEKIASAKKNNLKHLNDDSRCIRNPGDRLWAFIERYELRNHLDLSIVTPFKRTFKNPNRK